MVVQMKKARPTGDPALNSAPHAPEDQVDTSIPNATGWVKLSNSILFDLSLSPLSVRIYAVIVRYVGGNGSCWPSQATLASDLGVTVRTVKRAVAELVGVGAISVDRGRGDNQQANTYRLTPGQHCPRLGTSVSPSPGHPCPHPPDTCVPIENKNQEEEPRRRTADFDFQEAHELTPPKGGADTVVAAWIAHFGEVRVVGTQVMAHILARLKVWTVDELVQSVKGYAKATAAWRADGKAAKRPSKFFGDDENIQQYVESGVEKVPFDQEPKIIRILMGKNFPVINGHRPALLAIQKRVDEDPSYGSVVQDAINSSNQDVNQLLEHLNERTTV